MGDIFFLPRLLIVSTILHNTFLLENNIYDFQLFLYGENVSDILDVIMKRMGKTQDEENKIRAGHQYS